MPTDKLSTHVLFDKDRTFSKICLDPGLTTLLKENFALKSTLGHNCKPLVISPMCASVNLYKEISQWTEN